MCPGWFVLGSTFLAYASVGDATLTLNHPARRSGLQQDHDPRQACRTCFARSVPPFHAWSKTHLSRAILRKPSSRLADQIVLDASEDHSSVKKAAAAQKRMKAERLAIEAERAQLEAERLALEAEKMRLESALQDPDTESPASPVAQPIQKSLEEAVFKDVDASNTKPVQDQLEGSFFGPGGLGLNASNTAQQANSLDTMFRQVFDEIAPQLNTTDVEMLKSEVFDMNTFYVTRVDDTPVGTIFRGNLRKNSSEVFATVSARVEERAGLRQRVQLFLLKDPLPPTMEEMQTAEPGMGPPERRPVFLATARENQRQSLNLNESTGSVAFAIVAFLISVFTLFGYGVSAFALNNSFLEKLSNGDIAEVSNCLPIAFGLFALQLVHEGAHLFMAKKYDLKLGIPFFVPSLQLGIYGSITRLLCFPRNRTELFDFAFAGPAAAGVLSLLLFFVGLMLTASTSTADAALATTSMPVIPTGFLQSSLLLGGFANLVLREAMQNDLVAVHPMLVIGFTSTLITAINLIPVGKLDGGRMATAALGQGPAQVLGGLSLFAMALSSVFGNNPVLLFWGLVVIFLQRGGDVPSQDEVTEVSSGRSTIAYAMLFLTLLLLTPYPSAQEVTTDILSGGGTDIFSSMPSGMI